jgi:hypothetical protein
MMRDENGLVWKGERMRRRVECHLHELYLELGLEVLEKW